MNDRRDRRSRVRADVSRSVWLRSRCSRRRAAATDQRQAVRQRRHDDAAAARPAGRRHVARARTAPTTPTGVSGDTITIGTSLPQSGTYAAFNAILNGEKAYFDYINANGGVEVAGKKYQIKLVAKDDAVRSRRRRSPTCSHADQRTTRCSRCSTSSARRTTSRSATRSTSSACPTCFAASGATQWGNHKYPWMIGSRARAVPARGADVRRLPEEEQARRDDRGAARPTTTSASRTPTRSTSWSRARTSRS